MAEYIAAEKLGLRLAPARTAGHDAVRKNRDGSEGKIQIKGRACGKKPKRGLRMGRIKRGADCESVVLVLLDDVTLDPHGMWEAPYAAVEARQLELRTEKGLRVTDFKNIAKLVWPTAAEKGQRTPAQPTWRPSRLKLPLCVLEPIAARLLRYWYPNWYPTAEYGPLQTVALARLLSSNSLAF